MYSMMETSNYLLFSMPTFIQNFLTGQLKQKGEIGTQTSLPWRINKAFNSRQYLFGRIFFSSNSVLSAFLVSTHPNLLATLWTFTSTGITSLLNANPKTIFAVFLPMPFISSSFSSSAGTFPLYFFNITLETCLSVLALTL